MPRPTPTPRTVATPVSFVRVLVEVYADTPSGFAASATIVAHDHTVGASGRTANSAAGKALSRALETVPAWIVSDHAKRKELRARIAQWLRTTGVQGIAGEVEEATSTAGLRRVAVSSLGPGGASEQQAAAIGLLAEMLDAEGVHERLRLHALEALLDAGTRTGRDA
jgi:hypothetical protein